MILVLNIQSTLYRTSISARQLLRRMLAASFASQNKPPTLKVYLLIRLQRASAWQIARVSAQTLHLSLMPSWVPVIVVKQRCSALLTFAALCFLVANLAPCFCLESKVSGSLYPCRSTSGVCCLWDEQWQIEVHQGSRHH